jgi:hypothetical protein
MGTNYYAIPKADDEVKAKIKQAIENDDFATARELLPEKIHIGKSSGGWRFLFNHNDWVYFEQNFNSVAKFINRCKIYTEYGEEISPSRFWHFVDTKQSLKPEIEYGVIIDGLCFSNYTEFS